MQIDEDKKISYLEYDLYDKINGKIIIKQRIAIKINTVHIYCRH